MEKITANWAPGANFFSETPSKPNKETLTAMGEHAYAANAKEAKPLINDENTTILECYEGTLIDSYVLHNPDFKEYGGEFCMVEERFVSAWESGYYLCFFDDEGDVYECRNYFHDDEEEYDDWEEEY